jgi:Rieske 2Fe-2S family protein
VDRTRVECTWLYPPETLADPGFDASAAVAFWDVTNEQDWRACESVQRGAAGRGYRQGPLSEQEASLRRFLTLLAEGYRTGRVPLGRRD